MSIPPPRRGYPQPHALTLSLTYRCLCSYDEKNHERFPVGDPNKRAFTYFVLTGARFMYASAMRLVVLKFLLSWAVRI